MKKSTLAILLGTIIIIIATVLYLNSKNDTSSKVEESETVVDLPINTLELSKRPYVTLSPDNSGRSLNFTVASAPNNGEMEYELVYQSLEKQEGVFGRLNLSSESQPIIKSLLLGSKSGGGKITYHEGVTGGSLTLTYDNTRLKESWNFLTFDPTDPTISSTDARFQLTFPPKSLKKGDKVVTMKTFGYPKDVLPDNAKVIAGPYGYFSPTSASRPGTKVMLKLPAGEHTNPTLYEFDGKSWKKLSSKLENDFVTTTTSGNIFLVISE